MPKKVDEYYKKIKKENPEYDESKAWATAWSLYCKNNESKHCKKDKEEYLNDKNASLHCLANIFYDLATK
jgi:hypothetical protein